MITLKFESTKAEGDDTMKKFLFFFTVIAILASVFLAGCGGAKGSNKTTAEDDININGTVPKEIQEYNYFMEQAGLAQAEDRKDDALDYYLSAADTMAAKGTPNIKEADAHYEAAQIAYQTNQKELSIQEYEKAIEIYIRFDGNSLTKGAVAYTNLGVIWKELHEKNKARSCWQSALDLYNNAPANSQNKVHIEKIQQNIRDLDQGF
jgi:tetratricopeptide (TPR) repeat protein